ncbi:MAG: hypothetical protein U0104_13960 [Gemmatimonadales bacterium]
MITRGGTRRACLLLLLAAAPVVRAPALAAQAAPPIRQAFPMPEEYRGIQLRAQETQRTLLLAMVDSMPEALFRRAAADGQRDFAEQVHHAANANQYIVAHYQLGWDSLPVRADTAVVFNSRAGLRAFVEASYAFSLRVLREQAADDRQALIWYFGQKMPKWMVWDELNQHTIWTAGQIVANFRAAGMPPPSFLYF